MRKNEDDIGYWAGWFISFGIAAAFFIYAVLQGKTLQSALCDSAEKDCFREWTSALGGWATLLVAVPTLIYLAQQVKGADKHHKINAALSLRRQRALAKNVLILIRAVDQIIDEMIARVENTESPITHQTIDSDLDYLHRLLTKSHFALFETEIETPPVSVAFLENRISKHREHLSEVGATTRVNRKRRDKTLKIYSATKSYTGRIRRISEMFRAETSDYNIHNSHD